MATKTPTEIAPTERDAAALNIVNTYVGWSAGAGLIPVPVADVAAISLVQLKMINSLSKHYDVPFTRHLAKNIVGALVGSIAPYTLAAPAASLAKMVPVVGTYAGMVAMPAMAAASTYALGKVFIQHFASGGTFLDMDPEKVSSYFEQQYTARAKELADEKKAPGKAA